jgi:hypothetical protein
MRYSNGEIWRADPESIINQITSFFGVEINPEDIEPEEGDSDVFKV